MDVTDLLLLLKQCWASVCKCCGTSFVRLCLVGLDTVTGCV